MNREKTQILQWVEFVNETSDGVFLPDSGAELGALRGGLCVASSQLGDRNFVTAHWIRWASSFDETHELAERRIH